MGNTVTKEADASTQYRRSSASKALSDSELFTGSSTTSNQHHSNSTHSSHRSHHHSSTKHRKSTKKRNPVDYEMIVDYNETVDGGFLFPQGVYTIKNDCKVPVIREVIIRRKMAPFYKGLDFVESEWTDDELIEKLNIPEPSITPRPGQPGPATKTQLIWLYRNTHECPICFLVYPRLNSTRCCGQGICSECFVQIKRNPPHPPVNAIGSSEATDVLDLLSEPAACPFCAKPDLGVVFEAPPFEWGLPCPAPDAALALYPYPPRSASTPSDGDSTVSSHSFQGPFKTDNTPPSTSKPLLDFSKGVTVDMIRPDWEENLASARRKLARKANAARRLHQAALLPNDANENADPNEELAYSQVGLSSSSRRLTSSEARALEQKMIEEAIKASLAH